MLGASIHIPEGSPVGSLRCLVGTLQARENNKDMTEEEKTGSSSYAFSESQSAVGTSGPRSFVLRGASVMTSCQTADSRQLRDKKRSTHRRSSSCATWGS